VDFHNSSIMADAKRVDPETKRTLPVLTKPDLIDTGAETTVKELLLGEKTEGFRQGFHMVKGRGQASLDKNVTISEGLQKEKEFFQLTKPWCDLDNRMLFGIPNLRRKLGQLQIEMAREAFPEIKEEISKQKESATSELSRMGTVHSSSAEKRLFFTEVKDRLVRVLNALLSGRNTQDIDLAVPLASADFHDECSRLSESLQEGRLFKAGRIVQGTRVIILYRKEELRGTVMKIDGSLYYFDIDVSNGTPIHDSHFVTRGVGVATEKRAASTLFFIDEGDLAIVRSPEIGAKFDVLIGLSKNAFNMKPDRDWLQKEIQRNRPYNVPVFTNYEIFQSIVRQFIEEDWLTPCKSLVESVRGILKRTVKEVLNRIVR